MAIDVKPLTVLKVDPQIVPVGITPAVTVNGEISTQIAGRGEGIFSDIVNAAALLYSTVKPPSGTTAAVTAPAAAAGTQTGTGNFTESTSTRLSESNGNILMAIIWIVLGWFALKALKILK